MNRQPLVYAADETVLASKAIQDATSACGTRNFCAQECLTAAGMSIFPFATSHDAAASFGFRLESNDDAAGFMTDTGIVTPQAHAHLTDVRLLAIESNHDPKMLREGPYPYVVKQRIASNLGHLSNEQAAEELASLLSDRLQAVAAMHISENNNEYDRALDSFRAIVRHENHAAHVLCGYQGRLTTLC